MTLGIIGSAISTGTISGVVAIICIAFFSAIRIIEEEELMNETFGEDYKEYCNHVKTFIPWIW